MHVLTTLNGLSSVCVHVIIINEKGGYEFEREENRAEPHALERLQIARHLRAEE